MKSKTFAGLGAALLSALLAPALAAERPPLQIVVKQLKPDLRDRLKVVVQVQNLGTKPVSILTVTCKVSKDNKVLGTGEGVVHNVVPNKRVTAEVLVPAGTLQNGLSAACRAIR